MPGLFSVGFGAVQFPLYDKLHPRRSGEELGGLIGVQLYMQRFAVQAAADLIDAL